MNHPFFFELYRHTITLLKIQTFFSFYSEQKMNTKPTPTTTAVLVALPSPQTHTDSYFASHFVLSIFYWMSQINVFDIAIQKLF